MEARRPRLIIKAYLRGLLTPLYNKYGLRSVARQEVILAALAAEEDAELAWRSALLSTAIYSSHIQKSEYVKDFALRLFLLLDFISDRLQYKKASLVIKTKEQMLADDPATSKLIHDFNYMKTHGILKELKDKILEHRKKHGIT